MDVREKLIDLKPCPFCGRVTEYIDLKWRQIWKNGFYTAHEVAVIIADLFGDDCACNFNGNDEWLPYLCELQDACPHPCGVACWEQYLKYKDRKEETLKKYGFILEAKYKEA